MEKRIARARAIDGPARDLALLLRRCVRANGFPVPAEDKASAWASWLIAMDQLLRIGPPGADGAEDLVPSPDEVERVIEWATTDEFWRTNIRSADKFREQYPQLRAKCNTAREAAPATHRVGQFDAGVGEW